MRILVTGSRNLEDRFVVYRALDKYIDQAGGAQNITVIQGKARGTDTFASDWCRLTGATDEGHAADWDQYGKIAGWIRNQKMVNSGAIVCLAFPRGESRGTRDCIRRAEAAGIPVVYG